MAAMRKYKVFVRGPVPADIGERVARMHAEAIRPLPWVTEFARYITELRVKYGLAPTREI